MSIEHSRAGGETAVGRRSHPNSVPPGSSPRLPSRHPPSSRQSFASSTAKTRQERQRVALKLGRSVLVFHRVERGMLGERHTQRYAGLRKTKKHTHTHTCTHSCTFHRELLLLLLLCVGQGRLYAAVLAVLFTRRGVESVTFSGTASLEPFVNLVLMTKPGTGRTTSLPSGVRL